MAVLDSVPGLEVLVCVEGKPLPEYDDEDQEREPEPANHVCKYVESISDREYTINIRFNVPFTMNCPSLVVYIKIDGILMNSPVILKRDYPGAFRGEELLFPFVRVVKGKAVDVPGRDNVEQIQNFRFSKIQTTTDDEQLRTVEKDAKHIAEVGEMEIKVYRADEGKPAQSISKQGLDTSSTSKIHEKALKGQAKSHATSLGPANVPTGRTLMDMRKIDGLENPLAVFKLRYRSRESLKSLLIIDRTPSPEPERSATPTVDSLNPEQRRELDRFLKGLVNNRDGSSSTPDRKIKREYDHIKNEGSRKRRRSGEKVTIDLTEDSDDGEIVTLD